MKLQIKKVQLLTKAFLQLMQMVLIVYITGFYLNASSQSPTEKDAVYEQTSESQAFINSLSEEDRAWLNTHPVIKVVQDPGWPPVEFTDEHGKPSGMAADYLNLVEGRLGVKFKLVKGLNWQDAYDRLKRWEIDMTTSVAETPDRAKFWAFTKPYMKIPIVIITHTDVTYIDKMRELAGKKVAVVDGYAVNDWIPRDFPDIQLIKVKNVKDGLELLQRGKVFAYIDNMLVTGYYLAKLRMTNLKIAGETPYVNAQCMAVRKDWAPLAGILQKALASISETKSNDIYRKWLPIRYEHGFDYTLLWYILAIFITIVSGLAAWNWKLAREIRFRKKAQKDLVNSENKFRIVFESANVGKSITLPTGEIIVNQAFCDMLGYTRDEFKNKKWQELTPADEIETNQKLPDQLIQGEQNSVRLNKRYICKNGSFIWADVSVVSYRDTELNPLYFITTLIDITDRKLAEEELKKYREHLEELVKERTNDLNKERNLLRTLIDSLPDEIYAKDNESRFILANYNVLRTFGKNNVNDILTKTDFDILPREDALKAYEKEHSVLKPDGQMINYEEQIKDKDGKIRWLEVTKVPMRDKDDKIIGLVGINKDITEFKEIEKNLKEAKDAAETANFAKSTFLSSMSHEIRTPMNAILGFSQLMLYDENLTENQIKWINTINRSGEHLLTLINDILEISRIESGRITYNPSIFDLHSLLSGIEEMFRLKTDAKNLTLLFEYSDKLPKNIVTDESKLRQILINLVGNAVKFTKEGSIALRVRMKQENDKMQLIAEIEDTGPGISANDIDKLFNKFEQTKSGIMEGGTGLGLAISQQYAKLMNGIITVKSESGKGSCFILTIDIDGDDTKGLTKKEKLKQRITGLKPGQKQYRILIADDRDDNRELLKVLLISAGFKVEEARDGKETIDKFKIWLPDLILMDMQMPIMDGYETTLNIKAIKKGNIPIVAVTASAFQEDRQKALDAGADAYLRKPFKEDELFACIGSCLDVQYVYE